MTQKCTQPKMNFPDVICNLARLGNFSSHMIQGLRLFSVLYEKRREDIELGKCFLIIWDERNRHEESYSVALFPDAKELRLTNRTLNYEKIRRKQELFKLARIHCMKFKEYLENAVKAVHITGKHLEYWPLNDFDHLLEEANEFALEHRSSQGYPQSHKITSHSPNSTGLYDSPNGSSISELERIGEFEVTQVSSSQEQFPPEEFDIMSSNHVTIKPRLSRIYTQKFSKFKNPDSIGKVIVAVDGDGYQGRTLIQCFYKI